VAAGGTKQIIRYDANDKETIVSDSINGNDLVVANNGNIYVTVPDGIQNPSKIFLIRPNGEKILVDEGLKFANGITLSPDQTQLYITESASHWVWIYKIEADGTLKYKQRFGWLHSPDNADNAWADGLKCDKSGSIYVSSRLGIQVLDQQGKVNTILPTPNGQASNCCFGGPEFNILYVTCGDKVYRRKLMAHGANTFEDPVKTSFQRY
jgi:gluconolactonase